MRNSLIFRLLTGIVGGFVSLASFAGVSDAPQIPAREQAIADVILGELAIAQNQLNIAQDYYLAATQLSHDPETAKRAVYLALMAGQLDMATSAAKQWATIAPKDPEAQLLNVDLLLKAKQTAAVIPYLQQALQVGDSDTVNVIIGELQQVPSDTQKALLASIMQLPTKQQTEPGMQLITSLLQFQTGNTEQAIKSIDNVLANRPAWPQPIALKADYLVHLNQVDKAVQFTGTKAKQYPQTPMIQLVDAEMLLKAKQQTAAINKLQALKNFPETRGIALLTLAQLALQQEDLVNAKAYLNDATSDPVQANTAYYLLGEVYQFEHKDDQAIQAYQQVGDGQYYITSQLKAALLMSAAGQDQNALEALSNIKINNMGQAKQVILLQVEILMKTKQDAIAMQLLNKANKAIPNDIELLYARSMVASALDDDSQSEKDLKQILSLNPNQTTALNALGYLLISNPSRYQEALSYTQRALTLAPKDPAVLDTMGWLQYHMGNYQSAYHYLNQAYQLDYDGVIAAHYGEVLWQMGNKPEAKQVWQAALLKFPNDPDLLSTISRFNSVSKQ